MNRDFYNASGCPDPTAYAAINNIHREESRLAREKSKRLIKAIKKAIETNGFILLNRIEIKDIKSGTVFK